MKWLTNFSVLLLLAPLSDYVKATTWVDVDIPTRLANRRGSICTSTSLSNTITSYAINFQPEVVSPNVERFSLYVCGIPRTDKRYWFCDKQAPCALSDGVVVYSWVKGVPDIPLPLNVGFRLGGRTPWKYFVLQAYFSDDGSDGLGLDGIVQDIDNDRDGVSVQFTTIPQKYIAGIYSFSATDPRIGGHQINVGCDYKGNQMVPFAYREGKGRKWDQMSAYRVRANQWSLINTPAVAQNIGQRGAFEAIPSDDMMVVKPGDFLAASCTRATSSLLTARAEEVEECRLHLLYYMKNNALADSLRTTCSVLLQTTHLLNLPLVQTQTQKQQQPVTIASTNSITDRHIDTSTKSIRMTSPSMVASTAVATTGSEPVTTAASRIVSTGGKTKTDTEPDLVKNSEHMSSPLPLLTQMGDNLVISGSSLLFQPGHLVNEWWSSRNLSLGILSGVGLSESGRILYTLHRGVRNVTSKSFDDEHYYKDFTKPISHNTITRINTTTQQVEQTSGRGIFYLPYSLTLDGWGNVWVTDIGLHQVFKFSSTLQKLLVLGTSAIPGTDSKHFCKPSDVAVDEQGYVYVADGLCNQRIMKFDQSGKLIKAWSDHITTPHNIVVDRTTGMVYVSDIHSHSLIQYDTNGNFIKILRHFPDDQQHIHSVAFNHDAGGILHTLSTDASQSQCLGQIIATQSGDALSRWRLLKTRKKGPCYITVSPDNKVLYVASGTIVSKMTLGKVQQVRNENSRKKGIWGDNYYSEIRIIKASEDENHIRTALIVVVVLGTPVVLSVLMMLVQYIILKLRHRRVRMKRNLYKGRRGSGVWCTGCCVTRKHYFQSNGGMEEFMINSNGEDSGSEEELFARKT